MKFCSERSEMRLQIEIVYLYTAPDWKPSRSSWGIGKFHRFVNSGLLAPKRLNQNNLKGFSVSCACHHGMTNQHLLGEARSSLQRPSSQPSEKMLIGLVSVLCRHPQTVSVSPTTSLPSPAISPLVHIIVPTGCSSIFPHIISSMWSRIFLFYLFKEYMLYTLFATHKN